MYVYFRRSSETEKSNRVFYMDIQTTLPTFLKCNTYSEEDYREQ